MDVTHPADYPRTYPRHYPGSGEQTSQPAPAASLLACGPKALVTPSQLVERAQAMCEVGTPLHRRWLETTQRLRSRDFQRFSGLVWPFDHRTLVPAIAKALVAPDSHCSSVPARLNEGMRCRGRRDEAASTAADRLLRQLGDLARTDVCDDTAFTLVTAAYESGPCTLFTGATWSATDLDTFAGGGLDFIGALLPGAPLRAGGVREQVAPALRPHIPPGYSQGQNRWRYAGTYPTDEHDRPVETAGIPRREHVVAYGSYIAMLDRTIISPALGGVRNARVRPLELRFSRFLRQLTFGGPYALDYETWRTLSESRKEQTIGFRTVFTFLQAQAGNEISAIQDLFRARDALDRTFRGFWRYRRALYSAANAEMVDGMLLK